MSEEETKGEGHEALIKDLEPIKDTKVDPMVGVAAIALNMAIKYHDATVIKDGVLYQQYRMENKEMTPLGLEDVFATARQMERHLISAPSRLLPMMLDMLDDLQGVADEGQNVTGEQVDKPEEES